jgi:glutathione S-transferase
MPMSIGDRAPSFGPPPPAAAVDANRIVSILSDCLSCRRAGGDFLLGSFGIIDAFYLPALLRFTTYNVDLPAPVAKYSERMNRLPAVQEWCAAARNENVEIEEIGQIVRQYPSELPSSCKI